MASRGRRFKSCPATTQHRDCGVGRKPFRLTWRAFVVSDRPQIGARVRPQPRHLHPAAAAASGRHAGEEVGPSRPRLPRAPRRRVRAVLSRSSGQQVHRVGSVEPSPAVRAFATAAPRSVTSSLAKMFETLFRTVFSLKPREAAMSRLERPSAMSPSTSRSRVVSSGKGCASPSRPAVKKWPMRRARAAPKITSPAATVRIARTMSSGVEPLRM